MVNIKRVLLRKIQAQSKKLCYRINHVKRVGIKTRCTINTTDEITHYVNFINKIHIKITNEFHMNLVNKKILK